MTQKSFRAALLISAASITLANCGGADDVASPGGGTVIINPSPTPTPTPPPPPPPTGQVTPAGGCPTIADTQGLSDQGTITGPTGTWRVCRLPNLIKTSITLTKIAGLLYELNGRVNVGCDGGFAAPTAGAPFTSTTVGCTTPLTADTNVTLTISPGVILYGNTGQSWLAVNRGNRISAIGSESQPIIFTSRDNVLGLNSDTSNGQWGGVVLMGRGVTTDCAVGTVAGGNCERNTEGSADLARYGGNDNSYNAGRISYAQFRYSGFVLGSNSELQGLTLESVGTGTILDHIQAHNSSDDGTEWFGGAPRMKYYIATNADDDSLDVDTGADAKLQWALLLQRPGANDSFMEIDSDANGADTPRTKLDVVNFLAVQTGVPSGNSSNQASMLFRGNSDTRLANGIVHVPNNECIRVDGTSAATLTVQSVVMQCAATKFIGTGGYTAAQVEGFFDAGANNNDSFTVTASLLTSFVNGAVEDAVPPFNANGSWSSFFDIAAHIGVAWTGSPTWWTGWACNSAYGNFGSASTNCTSLPTT